MMQGGMASFTQRNQITFIIRTTIPSKNEVVNLQPAGLRFSLAGLTGVMVAVQHIGFRIGEPEICSMPVQPMIHQYGRIFERVRIKRSSLNDQTRNREEGSDKPNFTQMTFQLASQGRR